MKRTAIFAIILIGISASFGQEIGAKKEPLPKSQEQLTSFIKKLYEDLLLSGDLQALEKSLAQDFQDHTPNPGRTADRNGFIQKWAELIPAMPIRELTIHAVLVGDRQVAIYYSITGNLISNWGLIPPSLEPITLHFIDLYTVHNGLISAHWGFQPESGSVGGMPIIAPPVPPSPPTPIEPPQPQTPKKSVETQKSQGSPKKGTK